LSNVLQEVNQAQAEVIYHVGAMLSVPCEADAAAVIDKPTGRLQDIPFSISNHI
jgi:hypothetical protein